MKEKKRFSLSLYMDDPIQREAWELLQEYPSGQRTGLICRALCRMHDESHMLDAMRDMLREIPLGVPSGSAEQTHGEPDGGSVGQDVLDFLEVLQNDDGDSFF